MAMANSIKPIVTFTVLSHPPDFAILLSRPGKNAQRAKGKAIAKPKPKKPTKPPKLFPDFTIYTIRELIKAEVQLNDTITNTSAIKKIPTKLLVLLLESSLFVQDAGRVISKAPKRDIPKRTNNRNTNKLKPMLVDSSYIVFSLNNKVINAPIAVNIKMMDRE